MRFIRRAYKIGLFRRPLTFEFKVVDAIGVESLSSVEDYKRAYFPDDTVSLRLEGRAAGRREENDLNIEINFSQVKGRTTLVVYFTGNSAREVAYGIGAEVKSILQSYKTSNQMFHYLNGFPFHLGISLVVGSVVTLMVLMKQLAPSYIAPAIIGAVTGMLSVFFVILYKPYSTFETRLNEKRGSQVKWVLLGFLGFFLFTVLGVYLRLRLLGF